MIHADPAAAARSTIAERWGFFVPGGDRIAMIFHEPMTSNPSFSIGNQFTEAVLRHGAFSRARPRRGPSTSWRAPESAIRRDGCTSIA